MNQEDFNVTVLESLTEKYGEVRADRTASLWFMATDKELDWNSL